VLAERTGDVDTAIAAVNDFDEIIECFREASHARYMELAEDQRNEAQQLVAELSEQ
jgi:hypothetical protein